MDVVEPEGMTVDTEQLAELQEALEHMERGEYQSLISQVPRAVKRKHLADPKMKNKRPEEVLKFSRPTFAVDTLFTSDRFNLTPRVFTKSTQNLEDHEKIPFTSAKDHLPYFEDHPFVGQFMNYQRLAKMRGTYVGQAAVSAHRKRDSEGKIITIPATEPTGFWKYVHDGKIHPSFLLHRTVTGRSASANPNAQNFPKHGRGNMKDVVKAFRRVFIAPPGWKLIGYARTSTVEQVAGFEAQKRELRACGVERLFEEKTSSVQHRTQLEAALDYVREGDTLVVTKLDRLARSTAHLLEIIDRLEAKEVGLRILDFGGGSIDTKSPTGKLMLTMFGAMAQFEREMMLERQREGIAKAKAAGKYKGRKPTAMAKADDVKRLKSEGMGATAIAQQLGIGRASVYRVLNEAS